MATAVPEGEPSPTELLIFVLLVLFVFMYNFLEFHFIQYLFRGFMGDRVRLTFDHSSKIYADVVSKCRVLHGRYSVTPWLSSPHLQTAFLTFHGRPPVFTYRRQLFSTSDGGTIALDWLFASDVSCSLDNDVVISTEDATPIVVVVPGLTSDSSSAYVKHLAYQMAKHGWNVVVENHRGLGGVSMTSDCFYNAGWTEDVREVANHLHQKYSMASLFAIGTSLGANILVKYLGEEGEKTPFAAAASICSPWDLVVCDRFIRRKLIQRLYDRALAIGLKGYAQLHEPLLARLANWDGIRKSRSVRDFDSHATCLVGKFQTVDTYYRHCNSVSYVGNVSVPLLCISALDDPVCTKEAIPWDECRSNKNIILATTAHGGHLAFYEGITANSVWWVRAVLDFLSVLHSSPHMHVQKVENIDLHSPRDSPIDKTPYINITEDGLVAVIQSEASANEDILEEANTEESAAANNLPSIHKEGDDGDGDGEEVANTKMLNDVSATPAKWLFRSSRKPMWLLLYIAIVSSWPLVGSALFLLFRKKLMGYRR